ncbi:hypothetical protein NQZ68_037049 [Dissostichus eleginoides]|uniref:Pyrophosphoryl-undecaprenol N-acetylglucosamine transferase n=1 Tax=Dissostichus eleginoides TaxID=100907 RepID=A0AAD9F2X9_DISEL|nr:hypothetical protein NQZ68_037049 [Dissostichus eleginoides]KAK1886837.1 Pyrophosphoryl-undecaprenol N-acetylglucosamine transferase [Dissostichus eleginoides]
MLESWREELSEENPQSWRRTGSHGGEPAVMEESEEGVRRVLHEEKLLVGLDAPLSQYLLSTYPQVH